MLLQRHDTLWVTVAVTNGIRKHPGGAFASKKPLIVVIHVFGESVDMEVDLKASRCRAGEGSVQLAKAKTRME